MKEGFCSIFPLNLRIWLGFLDYQTSLHPSTGLHRSAGSGNRTIIADAAVIGFTWGTELQVEEEEEKEEEEGAGGERLKVSNTSGSQRSGREEKRRRKTTKRLAG